MIHTLCLASTGVSRARTATPAQTGPAWGTIIYRGAAAVPALEYPNTFLQPNISARRPPTIWKSVYPMKKAVRTQLT